jgi:hypothetical protein
MSWGKDEGFFYQLQATKKMLYGRKTLEGWRWAKSFLVLNGIAFLVFFKVLLLLH